MKAESGEKARIGGEICHGGCRRENMRKAEKRRESISLSKISRRSVA